MRAITAATSTALPRVILRRPRVLYSRRARIVTMSTDTYHMGPATLRYEELCGRVHCAMQSLSAKCSSSYRISRKRLHSATRQKLIDGMKKAESPDQLGVVLLRGGGPFHIYSTDMEGIFRCTCNSCCVSVYREVPQCLRLLDSNPQGNCRQESYFHYLFGVQEEDFFGAVDLQTGQSHLFIPRLPDSYAVWMGGIKVCLLYSFLNIQSLVPSSR